MRHYVNSWLLQDIASQTNEEKLSHNEQKIALKYATKSVLSQAHQVKCSSSIFVISLFALPTTTITIALDYNLYTLLFSCSLNPRGNWTPFSLLMLSTAAGHYQQQSCNLPENFPLKNSLTCRDTTGAALFIFSCFLQATSKARYCHPSTNWHTSELSFCFHPSEPPGSLVNTSFARTLQSLSKCCSITPWAAARFFACKCVAFCTQESSDGRRRQSLAKSWHGVKKVDTSRKILMQTKIPYSQEFMTAASASLRSDAHTTIYVQQKWGELFSCLFSPIK